MTDAVDESEYTTRERAHEIWVRLGRPHGRSLEHWIQAEKELIVGHHLDPGGLQRDASQAFADEASRA